MVMNWIVMNVMDNCSKVFWVMYSYSFETLLENADCPVVLFIKCQCVAAQEVLELIL